MHPVDLVAGVVLNVLDQISLSQDCSKGVRVSFVCLFVCLFVCSSFTKVKLKFLCTLEGICGSGRIASKSLNLALGIGEG